MKIIMLGDKDSHVTKCMTIAQLEKITYGE